MPTRAQWKSVHTDLMKRLGLPCKLRFSAKVKIGQHIFVEDRKTLPIYWACHLDINPTVDFSNPEHLILHEAAHHRHFHSPEEFCPCPGIISHCKHWAKILCDMYEETGITLPHGTGFHAFAKVARIKHITEYLYKVEKPAFRR